jgi:hypothetical protein
MLNDIIERYKRVTRDEDWIVKILLGGLFCYIPVLGHAVAFGFIMDLLEDLREQREVKLPRWQNLEKLFLDGLPMALMALVLGVAIFLVNFVVSWIPCFGFLAGMILALAFSLIMPALLVIFAFRRMELQNWQEAMNPTMLIEEIQKKFQDYLPVLLLLWVCSLASLFVGCCGILAPFPLFYTAVVFYPMIGEIYLKEESPGAAVSETAPAGDDSPKEE